MFGIPDKSYKRQTSGSDRHMPQEAAMRNYERMGRGPLWTLVNPIHRTRPEYIGLCYVNSGNLQDASPHQAAEYPAMRCIPPPAADGNGFRPGLPSTRRLRTSAARAAASWRRPASASWGV